MDTVIVQSTIPKAVPNEDPRQCWSTPPEFIHWAEESFGAFDLDVCANHDNAQAPYYFGAPGYLPPENNARNWIGEDGLRQAWTVPGKSIAHCWCNPGFANVEPWLAKAAKEARDHNAHVLILTHASHSPAWFGKYIDIAHRVWAIRPRINFVMPPGVAKASSNPRDSFLFEFQRNATPSHTIHVAAPWKELSAAV